MTEKYNNNFWVVINMKFPTSISYKHQTEEHATDEAKRLARLHPNNQFVVMKSVVGYEVSDLAEMKFVDSSCNPDDSNYIPF